MVSHVWSALTMLTIMMPGEWFSVAAMFSGGDAGFAGWYVNFEEPFRRGTHAVHTNDLLLDLVVDPDGTPRWKDLAEYEHGRRVGFIDSRRHRHVQEARDRAVQMVAAGSGPFGEGWEHWRPDPDWLTPAAPRKAEPTDT